MPAFPERHARRRRQPDPIPRYEPPDTYPTVIRGLLYGAAFGTVLWVAATVAANLAYRLVTA